MRLYYVLDLGDKRTPIPVDDCEILLWGAWFATADRRVALDELPGGGRVSTVFLGIDHNFGVGPPLLWETMVFGPDKDALEQQRYSSYDEALKGHAEFLHKFNPSAVRPEHKDHND